MIFDGLLYKDKPDLGLPKVPHINENTIMADGAIDEIKLREIIKKAGNDLHLIDIESPLYSYELWNKAAKGYEINKESNLQESLNLYMQVSNIVRSENPGFRFGFYDVLPESRYWRQGYIWKARNEYFKPLAKHVDVIFPSCYTFYDDPNGWELTAKNTLEEAKRYNRPVYPYIWPKYHESSLFKGQYIPTDYWRLQIETCLNNADGLVLWGGAGETWDNNAQWWAVVKEYL